MNETFIFLHRFSRNGNSFSMCQIYVTLKNKYKETISLAKLTFNREYIENGSNKCKVAWKVINSNLMGSVILSNLALFQMRLIISF